MYISTHFIVSVYGVVVAFNLRYEALHMMQFRPLLINLQKPLGPYFKKPSIDWQKKGRSLS